VPRLRERIDALVARFDLGRFRDTKCGVLSSGEQTRVALAKAMLNRPQLLLLDEPTASLDPEHARGLWERVRGARTIGAAAIVATHFLDETVEADRVLTLRDGRLVEGET
jgi:ABC-2 type transport system ATP-binding protein